MIWKILKKMKTEVLSLIDAHGPLSTSKILQLLDTTFDVEVDQQDLFDLLNNEAKRHNLVRSTGSKLGGQGTYKDILCFYWSTSE